MSDNSGPAFPLDRRVAFNPESGLTKREYFAVHASVQEMAVAEWGVYACAAFLGIDDKDYDWEIHYPQVVAKRRFQFADAMLAESQK